MKKLHLGCGERYLEGYINIDFAQSEHTVMKSSADQYSNILDLRYTDNSVDEVRLHHVFEHFPRPIACALFSSWFCWLKVGRILHIEVPDLQKTVLNMLKPFVSIKQHFVSERHIFGSHEASWAVHYEGYTPRGLRYMFKQYGFKIVKEKKNKWQRTYNFELIARKSNILLTKDDLFKITKEYLSNFLVGKAISYSEERLLNVWLEIYKKQMGKSCFC